MNHGLHGVEVASNVRAGAFDAELRVAEFAGKNRPI